MMIALTDTDSAGIAAEFVRARTRAGSPAMGMVLTMVIVADEEHADTAMEMGREASHEHPARVLGVILGDGRGASQVDAQVGTGSGWTGETALIRLNGEVVKHPDSVVLPLLLPDSPVAVWWPTDPPAGPGQRPARHAGAAPDHRLGQRHPRRGAGAARPVHGLHARQHRPGLDPADAVARAAGRRARPAPAQGHRRRRSPPSGSAPAPTSWSPGCATGSRSTWPAELRGAGHHRGRAGDRRGPDPDRAARRPAGDVLLPRPARPADRAAPARRPRAARRGAAPARRGRRVRRRRPDAHEEQGTDDHAPADRGPRLRRGPGHGGGRRAAGPAGRRPGRRRRAPRRADRRHHRRRRAPRAGAGCPPAPRSTGPGSCSGGATSASSRPTRTTATSGRPGRPSSTTSTPTRPSPRDALDGVRRVRRGRRRAVRRRAPQHGSGDFDVARCSGSGPDGHVASLFPGFPAARRRRPGRRRRHRLPQAAPRADQPHLRGAQPLEVGLVPRQRRPSKAEAVARALADGTDPHDCPAAGVTGLEETIWFLDRPAASAL